jgi:HK97 family phage major capsid protein
MDMEKQYNDLSKDVASLREMLEMKFDPSKQKEEADKLFKTILDRVHPERSPMKWAINAAEGDKKVYLGQFLKAITPGMSVNVPDEVMAHIKTTLTTSTSTPGSGYTVPVEYATEIIKLEREYSKIRNLARIFPMGSATRRLPTQLTNVSVTWTSEGVAKTETNPTFSALTQTAQKVAAVVKMTDELLEDNTSAIDTFIMSLVAEAIALEEDRVAFAGNTGASDPFMGVLYATGVNSVTPAGANISFEDVISLLFSLNERYREGATIVTSTAGLQLLMKLKDSQGRPLWTLPSQGVLPSIYGYNYVISDQIPTNLGTGTDETAILFGNFKKHFFVSDRGGYEVISSNAASDISGSASAFMEDETWFRFKKRLSLDVAQPEAFAKMLVK